MNNITKSENTPSSSGSNIYISDNSDTSDVTYSPLDISDGNTLINQISVPFQLSTSIQLQPTQKYRNTTGFTGQSGYEYARISLLTEFLKNARVDVCGSLFKDNWRGADRFIQSIE